MRSRLIDTDSPVWSACLEATPHDFYHLAQYVRINSIHERGRPLAFVAEEGRWRLFVPLIVRPIGSRPGIGDGLFDATSPYGYSSPLLAGTGNEELDVAFLDRAIEALVTTLRSEHIVSAFVRLHPTLEVNVPSLVRRGCVVDHGETVLIDLTRSAEDMWLHTRSSHRHEIQQARQRGYTAEIDGSWNELPAFQEIYAATMARVGARRYYLFSDAYFAELKEKLRHVLHLCVVRVDDRIAGAGMFSEVGGVVQYHLSGTRDEDKSAHPTKLMLDFVRSWAKARGNRVFHLGGGLGSAKDSLFAFKAGFSPLRARFRTWRLVCDDAAYSTLVRSWENRARMPSDRPQGFFPAYRKAIFGFPDERTF